MLNCRTSSKLNKETGKKLKANNARMALTAVLGCSILCLALPVLGQQTVATVYRGSVGGGHFQMHLNIQGNNVSGAYSYDSTGEDLKLTGKLDSQGRLELTESGAKGKPTGKFVCKRFDHAAEAECTWSKPDGTREAYLTLAEQHLGFTNGLQ